MGGGELTSQGRRGHRQNSRGHGWYWLRRIDLVDVKPDVGLQTISDEVLVWGLMRGWFGGEGVSVGRTGVDGKETGLTFDFVLAHVNDCLWLYYV